MRPLRLPRRTFLRGACGIAVGLPLLEAMLPSRASAETLPKRFVISWGGISIGGYGKGGMVVPSETGAGYTITRGLLPLEELGVEDAVTVVSGLLLPWDDGGGMPPAGRTIEFHYNTVGPQVAGTQTGPGRDGKPKGPTADQIMAGEIGPDALFPVLAYRVQPASYVGSNEIGGDSGRLSWKDDGSGGLTGVDPIVSPRLAYESLFTGFTPPDPAEAAAAELLLRRKKSVLDMVDRHAGGLTGKLGAADKLRMQQHLDEIRALEKRLDAIQPTQSGCALLPDPGEDPAIGESIIEYDGQGMGYTPSAGYSGEDVRADLLTDFIRMAFICDLSRSVSFMQTEWKCYMNMYNFGGWQSDMHELTHGKGPEESVADSVGFHVKQFARLVSKLRSAQEVDGSTVLDNSSLVMIFEGGNGFDPEGGNADSPHSTENMVCLVAGGGLVAGQHIAAPGRHPGEVVLTAMQAAGHVGGLGELTNGIDDLRV